VEDGVDPVHRTDQAIAVAHVADEEPDVAAVAQPLALVELFRLVASEDPDDLRLLAEKMIDEPSADRPGPAGDEDSLAAERWRGGDRGLLLEVVPRAGIRRAGGGRVAAGIATRTGLRASRPGTAALRARPDDRGP
jgi:hypothetical protein